MTLSSGTLAAWLESRDDLVPTRACEVTRRRRAKGWISHPRTRLVSSEASPEMRIPRGGDEWSPTSLTRSSGFLCRQHHMGYISKPKSPALYPTRSKSLFCFAISDLDKQFRNGRHPASTAPPPFSSTSGCRQAAAHQWVKEPRRITNDSPTLAP
ncbi:hypothetical protein N658DRAFT_63856 [Parathielavia hyrcaniae]|uniref:Uncharacterized protein n=1 Tax=Parathielavia hyrcaniae TaxID=113614 RepID=A0AAN6Q2D0_9PEZI|nr:hypothetical protein N658DRAFT_63856 [Parathielavia hyrcaniae]